MHKEEFKALSDNQIIDMINNFIKDGGFAKDMPEKLDFKFNYRAMRRILSDKGIRQDRKTKLYTKVAEDSSNDVLDSKPKEVISPGVSSTVETKPKKVPSSKPSANSSLSTAELKALKDLLTHKDALIALLNSSDDKFRFEHIDGEKFDFVTTSFKIHKDILQEFNDYCSKSPYSKQLIISNILKNFIENEKKS